MVASEMKFLPLEFGKLARNSRFRPKKLSSIHYHLLTAITIDVFDFLPFRLHFGPSFRRRIASMSHSEHWEDLVILISAGCPLLSTWKLNSTSVPVIPVRIILKLLATYVS